MLHVLFGITKQEQFQLMPITCYSNVNNEKKQNLYPRSGTYTQCPLVPETQISGETEIAEGQLSISALKYMLWVLIRIASLWTF